MIAPPAGAVPAGATFGMTVSAEDALGNVVPSFSGNIALALGNNPNGATLGGTVTEAAVAGVATFTGVVGQQGRGQHHDPGQQPAPAARPWRRRTRST